MCIDVSDNELALIEAIHLFVEILDHYFENVCELDLVFNFHKVGSCSKQHLKARCAPFFCCSMCYARGYPFSSHAAQVYLILDEFICGGEIQETAKKVRCVPITIALS